MTEAKPARHVCQICKRAEIPASHATCPSCVNRTRGDLHAIVNGYRQLPSVLRMWPTRSPGTGEGGSRNAETPVMGGDAMVLLAYGSEAAQAAVTRARLEQLPTPIREPSVESPHDPPSILFELERWEASFRQEQHVQAAVTRPTIGTVAAYLHDTLGWAAQHSTQFTGFTVDLEDLRSHIDRAVGDIDRPEVATAPCLGEGCGGKLIREWGPKGLDDEWACRKCRRRYTLAQYWQAVRAAAEAEIERAERAADEQEEA